MCERIYDYHYQIREKFDLSKGKDVTYIQMYAAKDFLIKAGTRQVTPSAPFFTANQPLFLHFARLGLLQQLRKPHQMVHGGPVPARVLGAQEAHF